MLNGETKVGQLLLERYNSEESGFNIKDEYGLTALQLACKYGHKDIVKLLLDDSERIELNAREVFRYVFSIYVFFIDFLSSLFLAPLEII